VELRRASTTNRALALVGDTLTRTWLESELADTTFALVLANDVAQVVATLVDAEPPRPQVLIIDLDLLAPDQLLHLHGIRERWFGSIVALGTVSTDLRRSLNVETVLPRPLAAGALRDALDAIGLSKVTTKMRPIR
jgi:hypothetical protein